ncbi:CmcJ/NvfI family oxidoreductase [Parasphingorhabdus sp.]|uniref:CmcJ/NvfI family oxidoreductase n=1 Tax=Parasphingorhabdus sp. TaxID=2709688 RepID=UPI003002FE31
MTADADAALSPATAEIDAKIQYLLPGSLINRRFWAPGEEYNTGEYAPYDVKIKNARLAGPFTLDDHGFAIERHKTDITDWLANYGPDGEYAKQVQDVARQMTGADFVIPMGGMIRTSGKTSKDVQPPAGEAHVDFTEKSATQLAERLYRAQRPDGKGYDRFICFSLWRVLSPPPQDWPLALCEGPSVKDGEGTHNTKVDVDVIPTGDDLFVEIPGEEDMMAATIFRYSPDHRWWYFPDMTADEVIFIKFYDSDHDGAWRAPHTAFPDTSRPDAIERRSFEFRGTAYFTND